MNSIPIGGELTIVALAFVIMVVGGLLFVVRGFKLPNNFSANAKKRKEIKRRLDQIE